MIAISQSVKMDLEINGEYFGKFVISKFLKNYSYYKLPFVRSEKKTLIKIGNGSYNDFDSFIIESLNDYYKKLSNPSDLDTKEKMLDNYTKLYSIWSKICSIKEEGNVIELYNLYNKISYGLYILGYEDKQL